MYVRCDDRHCIPGLTMSSLTEPLRECPGIIERCTQGLARAIVLHYANALR